MKCLKTRINDKEGYRENTSVFVLWMKVLVFGAAAEEEEDAFVVKERFFLLLIVVDPLEATVLEISPGYSASRIFLASLLIFATIFVFS